jgi:hypothetical protein
LDAADEACKHGKLDVTEMEEVIGGLLAKQLTTVFEEASGKAAS